MNKTISLSLVCLFAAGRLVAQTGMTLNRCIEYAWAHNTDLQKQWVSVAQQTADWEQSKAALFPSLQFSTSQTVMNRPFQNNSSTVSGTEIISSSSHTTYTGNYGLNLNWTLWNGKRNTTQVKINEQNVQMANQQAQAQKQVVAENVTKAYMQVLYAQETLNTYKEQAVLSNNILARAQALLKRGALAKPDVATLKSQAQTDQYNVVSAQNALQNYELQLKQLLEMDDTTQLTVEPIDLDSITSSTTIPSVNEVYRAALAQRADIQSAQTGISAAQLGVQYARAQRMPTLSLFASAGTTTASASNDSWLNQLKTGWNQMAGLTLSIPIFDNGSAKSSVAKANSSLNNARLELQGKQKQLYATISTLWQNADNARAQYIAGQTRKAGCQETYALVSEQFALGMQNTTELLNAKTQLLAAQHELLQARYMFAMNRALLNFYATNRIDIANSNE